MTDRQNVSPQLILSLKPIGAAGARVFARALRQKAPEHVQNQTIAPIDIRFDIPPKDPKRGHTFGSDKNSDYVLGEGNEGFSACTFRIQYIKEGKLMLFASAANGLSMTYDAEEGPITRDYFPFELFKTDSEIKVDVCGISKFAVSLPDHGANAQLFQRCKEKYLENVQDDMGDLESLRLNRQLETQQLGARLTSLKDKKGPAYVRAGILAQRSCGPIDCVRDVSSGNLYARKTFTGTNGAILRRSLQGAMNAKSSHLVKYVCLTEEYGPPQLIFQWLSMGNIEHQDQQKALTRLEVASLLLQGLQTLKGMHSAIQSAGPHGNIKPQNILVVSRRTAPSPFHVKLGDYRMPKECSSQAHPDCEEFWAPEMVNGNQISRTADVWALGLTAGKYLVKLPERNDYDADTKGRTRYCKAVVEKLKAESGQNHPPLAKLLLNTIASGMVVFKASNRESVSDLLGDNSISLQSRIEALLRPRIGPVPSNSTNQATVATTQPPSGTEDSRTSAKHVGDSSDEGRRANHQDESRQTGTNPEFVEGMLGDHDFQKSPEDNWIEIDPVLKGRLDGKAKRQPDGSDLNASDPKRAKLTVTSKSGPYAASELVGNNAQTATPIGPPNGAQQLYFPDVFQHGYHSSLAPQEQGAPAATPAFNSSQVTTAQTNAQTHSPAAKLNASLRRALQGQEQKQLPLPPRPLPAYQPTRVAEDGTLMPGESCYDENGALRTQQAAPQASSSRSVAESAAGQSRPSQPFGSTAMTRASSSRAAALASGSQPNAAATPASGAKTTSGQPQGRKGASAQQTTAAPTLATQGPSGQQPLQSRGSPASSSLPGATTTANRSRTGTVAPQQRQPPVTSQRTQPSIQARPGPPARAAPTATNQRLRYTDNVQQRDYLERHLDYVEIVGFNTGMDGHWARGTPNFEGLRRTLLDRLMETARRYAAEES